MVLGSDLEASVWRDASKVYGASLPCLLNQAIMLYKRQPDLDDRTRIHAASVGFDVLYALKSALVAAATEIAPSQDGYVEVRHGLRWHIARYVQCRLIDDGYAIPMMRDNYSATDLGL